MTPAERASAEQLEIVHEGRRARVYPDSRGFLTAGIGCYLDRGGVRELFAELGIDYDAVRSGRVAMTDQQIDAVFQHDLDAIGIAGAARDCPTFESLPTPAKLVLVDLAFQCGAGGLAEYHRMLAAIAERNWERAAVELLDSKEAVQTPMRAKGNAALMRSCAKVGTDELAALLARAQGSQVDLVAELDLLRPTLEDRDADPS